MSWAFDYLLILAWLVSLFIVVGVPSHLGWVNREAIWAGRAATDVAITLTTVVPLFAYLVVTESGPAHATWGKLRAGLRVTGVGRCEPGVAPVAIRNLVKVLPWQLGHMGAARPATGEAETLGPSLNLVSVVLRILVAGLPILGIRGIHDLAAGTVVNEARQAEQSRSRIADP